MVIIYYCYPMLVTVGLHMSNYLLWLSTFLTVIKLSSSLCLLKVVRCVLYCLYSTYNDGLSVVFSLYTYSHSACLLAGH